MANLQDIRRRIRSVKNMQQITKAMKMVSAAKLRRAQQRVVAARPYANTMAGVLSRLTSRLQDYEHPLLEQRGDRHLVLLLITADKGLCGAFNTNLVKAAQKFIRDNEGKNVDLVTVGRKGRDFFRRRNVPILREYVNLTLKSVEYSTAAMIARDIMELFTSEDSTVDRVYVLYNEFRSALSQPVTLKQLLPIGAGGFQAAYTQSHISDFETYIDYLYEQPPAEILGRLLPRYVETQVFRFLLESSASEQGARMTAMDSAAKNAGEVIQDLTLNMNRVRQASITREIIEVVSGSKVLEE